MTTSVARRPTAAVDETAAAIASVAAGDDRAFAALVERHRDELRGHCRRMLTTSDADDLVQETFLRAWRGRGRFAGRSSLRTWLYRIATNACHDAVARRARRATVPIAGEDLDRGHLVHRPVGGPTTGPPEPDAVVVARETVELGLLATVQHLTALQRSVLVLRDLLGWSAEDTASLLGTTVAAANSALQRARATLRTCRPVSLDLTPVTGSTTHQRALVQALVDAHDRADAAAVAGLADVTG